MPQVTWPLRSAASRGDGPRTGAVGSIAVPDDATSSPEPSFQALYRRFRPQRFAEVRGQDHVTLALRNAVRDGRVAHAYLFSGPRGTGKTSTARILGKALNCEAVVDGEPCGVCESCVAVAAGNSFDVHELDAASNNGVEAMRDLVARASLATPGRWKVYIVDEVHMLSTAASNALLKTLEEPPDRVVFVLATTDPQKVLPTIRSRTQQYDFHLLPDEVLAGLVEDVAAGAGLALPDGATTQAIRRGRGSARDTLSVLDQVAAAGVVADDSRALLSVISALADEDGGGALSALDGVVRSGRDPQQIAVELVEMLRTGFLSLAGARSAVDGAARLSADELETVRSLGLVRCVRAMELLGVALVAMRDAPDPRITLEVALYRSAELDGQTSNDALLERIERIERRLEQQPATPAMPAPPPPPPPPTRPTAAAPSPDEGQGTASDAAPPAPPAASGGRPSFGAFRRPDAGPVPTPPAEVAPTTPEEGPAPAAQAPAAPVAAPSSGGASTAPPPDRDAFVAAWGDVILPNLRLKVRALYQAGRFVAANDGVGDFALPNEAHVHMASSVRGEVAEALSTYFGRRVDVRLVVDDHPGHSSGAITRTPRPAADPAPAAAPAPEELGDINDIGEPIEDPEELRRAERAGAEWATERIREAFPGAEEIS